ncbi:MAG: hypothetical protein QNJ15_01655 [Erythrobacter sp.]|nr:hypothetical protein [Erythrobacter sp.]
MSFAIIFATIFLAAFVIIGGVVMYLSKAIDHGEARFDSETGRQLPDRQPKPPHEGSARPASRIEKADEASDGE